MPNIAAVTPNRRESRSRSKAFSEPAYKRLLGRIMPRTIRSAAENEAAIELVQRLDHGTPEQQALGELMTLLIEDFEAKRYPILHAEPRLHLRQLMEERGHTQAAVAKAINASRGAISDILCGRRQISKSQSRKLAVFYRVPADLFL
jgi:HTH-type transcriptional regulator / antitoxin HigA